MQNETSAVTRQQKFLFEGGGRTGALFRSVNWLKHPMGSPDRWPNSLKTMLNTLFHSQQPLFIFWGPDFFQFYNDACLSYIENNKSLAIGERAVDSWPEIWSTIKPQLDLVMQKGGSTWHENQLFPLFHKELSENAYLTYGFSPIYLEDGAVGGALVISTETTALVTAINLQKKSQDELIETLESMSDGFLSVDKNWLITQVNARREKATIYKRQDQIGKNLLELFFSDPVYKGSIYWKSYHKAMSERVFVMFEEYDEPFDLWTEVRVYPKKNDGGLAVFFTDITERKKIEFSLLTEREKLEAIVAQLPAGIALLQGSNFIFEKVNAEWRKLVGNRDYIGKTFLETYPELVDSPFDHALKSVYESGHCATFKEELVRVRIEDDKYEDRYYDLTYTRVNDGYGKPYGVFAHCLNVTERVLSRNRLEKAKIMLEFEAKASEAERAKFVAAFQTVTDGIFIFDSRGEPIFMNNAAARVFGSASAADLMRRIEYFFERLELREMNDEVIPLSEWPIARALRGESFKDWQLKAHRQDIDKHWIWSASGGLARQPYSDVTLGVVVLRDITAQKNAENDLKNAKLEAEKANDAKSSFLANMSHEIRTPLGAILGFTDLMKNTTSEQDRTEYASIINRNGKSLTRIIDDILDLSKVEAGRLELEKINFNVKTLIHEVVDLFFDTANKKGITLKYEIDPKTPEVLKSDPTRIRQILINLIGNAVKFTSHGSVSIHVSPLLSKDTFTHIQFAIADTGLGLTEEQISKLFEPFSQADESTTRKFGGSGLGLALSKRLAGALGGDVWVDSSAFGRGSTFIATVGATISTESQQSLDTHNEPKHRSHQNLAGVRVLLVEDAIDNQLLVKALLAKSGVFVTVADNGLEGIRAATQQEFDVILMDMQMPVLDGYSATERLRKQGYKGPIIALTAHAMAEERNRTALAGCDAHLTKPLDFEALTNTIQHYANRDN